MIYRQIRTGKDKSEFTMYKIKTMYGREVVPQWSSAKDRRVTPIGKLLRKYHLDELPQLWNILQGEMSLVGPRPERPHFDDRLIKLFPKWYERYSVRPGIMGLAQLRLGYTNTTDGARKKLVYDLFYIKKKSLGFDLWIIWQTIVSVISK